MKYAYIIGSNAFIVPGSSVIFEDQGYGKEFLKINSIYHDLAPTAEPTFLDIDLDIKAVDGTPVFMLANKTVINTHFTIETERDSVHVLNTDGSTIIHVHQLSDDAAMELEHNIVAELEVHAPIVVIRITGEFMTGDLHILAENEKLYINENGYATSAMVGKNQLKFTPEGVVL